MVQQIRQFILHKPLLSESGGVRLPALIPTYGIFHIDTQNGTLKKIETYDLDDKVIELKFAQVYNTTSQIPFETLESAEEEVDRLRRIELILPNIKPVEQISIFDNVFMKEAVLLTQLRMLAQFRIVLAHFESEENK